MNMISAVITTYKREPSLVIRAIDSVLCQTYRDIELIIVDDSPAEYPYRKGVEAIALERKKQNSDISIYYIAHDKNRGACAARNTGLRHAKGEFIAYLDDDDEWLPQKLEKQIALMHNAEVALVYCGSIYKNDKTGASINKETDYYRGFVHQKLLYGNFIGSTSFPLIRAECLKEINGFDEQMQSAQDYDVWIRLSEKYKVDFVPEPLVIYHEHDGIQISGSPLKKINGLERLNHKNEKYLASDAKLWHKRHIVLTPYYAMVGNKKQALRIWLQCIKKCPAKVKENMRYFEMILQMKKDNHG